MGKKCVCEDFNAVRSDEERRSVSQGLRSHDYLSFNQFIDNNDLVDLPLCGRSFTWYKGDGLSMSRLDSGRGKLGSPALANVEVLPRHTWIDSLKVLLSALDCKGEAQGLTKDDTVELYAVTSDIHSLTRMNTSICWQQARLMWLHEGDANSTYFHSILTSRRRRNALSLIMVDGQRVEGVQPVRQAVFSHFSSHFKAVHVDRPQVDDFSLVLCLLRKWGVWLNLFQSTK
ncbi:cysteine-rich receptor-like protein kinase [Trifolium pratense]|uniref:Cysteine-rich receptor-like protein kinase n=1 Tax=Trifolium pratense TaxID=57577 RepID=A0A2K3JK56_TRIPR|nr:cysteine-rich receptor-like protein kinase [Trifolium pratense]